MKNEQNDRKLVEEIETVHNRLKRLLSPKQGMNGVSLNSQETTELLELFEQEDALMKRLFSDE